MSLRRRGGAGQRFQDPGAEPLDGETGTPGADTAADRSGRTPESPRNVAATAARGADTSTGAGTVAGRSVGAAGGSGDVVGARGSRRAPGPFEPKSIPGRLPYRLPPPGTAVSRLEQLPTDVLLSVLASVGAKDMGRLAQCSHTMRMHAQNPTLWARLLALDFNSSGGALDPPPLLRRPSGEDVVGEYEARVAARRRMLAQRASEQASREAAERAERIEQARLQRPILYLVPARLWERLEAEEVPVFASRVLKWVAAATALLCAVFHSAALFAAGRLALLWALSLFTWSRVLLVVGTFILCIEPREVLGFLDNEMRMGWLVNGVTAFRYGEITLRVLLPIVTVLSEAATPSPVLLVLIGVVRFILPPLRQAVRIGVFVSTLSAVHATFSRTDSRNMWNKWGASLGFIFGCSVLELVFALSVVFENETVSIYNWFLVALEFLHAFPVVLVVVGSTLLGIWRYLGEHVHQQFLGLRPTEFRDGGAIFVVAALVVFLVAEAFVFFVPELASAFRSDGANLVLADGLHIARILIWAAATVAITREFSPPPSKLEQVARSPIPPSFTLKPFPLTPSPAHLDSAVFAFGEVSNVANFTWSAEIRRDLLTYFRIAGVTAMVAVLGVEFLVRCTLRPEAQALWFSWQYFHTDSILHTHFPTVACALYGSKDGVTLPRVFLPANETQLDPIDSFAVLVKEYYFPVAEANSTAVPVAVESTEHVLASLLEMLVGLLRD